MIAKFPGKCSCGSRFAAGALVTWASAIRKIVGCAACGQSGKATPGTDLGQPETPAAAGHRGAKPLPTPSAEAAKAAADALVARLDPNQQKVAAWAPATGSVRVVAAAGSGKTTTVVAMIARLVWEKVLAATEIVATTFTAKAGAELRERLAHVLPPGTLTEDASSPLRVGTFHSLALRALRVVNPGRWNLSRCLEAGTGRASGIPSTGLLWAKILDYAGPDGLPGTGAEGLGLDDADPRAYALAVGVARSRSSNVTEIEATLRDFEHERKLPYLARAWSMFEASKRALQAFDFADVIAEYSRGLDAGDYRDAARLVVVDEAQDNDHLQYRIAERLAANGGGSVMIVGDLRQSIYSWRGAAPDLYAGADKRLSASTLEIPTNYRSARRIVEVGNNVAAGQPWSLGVDSLAHRTDEGVVTVAGHDDPSDEAAAVAAEIAQAISQGERADAHAVLVRTNAAAASFEAALLAGGVPVTVVGGTSFFGRKDTLDALAYLSLAAGDDLDALSRVCNRPKRYLGKVFVAQVKDAPGETVLDRLDHVADHTRSRQASGIRDLRAAITGFRAALAESGLASTVAAIAALLAPPESESDADDDRGGLLPALVQISHRHETAASLLAFAARCRGEVTVTSENDDPPTGRVVVSTIHKAKGLEWPVVFVSASEGVFPHRKSMGEPERCAEEQRLFYVAATRAKDTLHLSYSDVDLYGRDAGPSRFLAFAETPEAPKGGGEPLPELPAITAEMPALTPAPTAEIIEAKVLDVIERIADTEPVQQTDSGPAFGITADKLAVAHTLAEKDTTASPKPASGRYVPVTKADFEGLLWGLGAFHGLVDKGQLVFEAGDVTKHGWLVLRVYTSIPADGAAARDVGEDSIKVALTWTEAGETRGVFKRLPYACRTHGWRLVLLDRIESVLKRIGKPCRKCGAPTVERVAQGSTFHGCVRFPACKGAGSREREV